MTTHSPNPVESLRALPELIDPELLRADNLRLHLGEMTAQELRTARAAIKYAWFYWNRRPASAPDAELLSIINGLLNTYDSVWKKEGDMAEYPAVERAQQFLAKHSTAAEEGQS